MCGSDLLKKLLSPQKFTFDLQLQIVSFKPPAPTYARSPQSSNTCEVHGGSGALFTNWAERALQSYRQRPKEFPKVGGRQYW